MSDAAVVWEQVSVSAPGVATPILRSITLQLQSGTTTALLGRSGAGKTTLLRTVNGLALTTSGTVKVGGLAVEPKALQALRRGIGYVIQDAGLYPHMSVERNVAMPLEIADAPTARRRERAAEVLRLVGLEPAEYASRMPWQLSGGQRQRVGVARALVNDPSLLLLDEPFGALDPLTRAEMQAMLRDLLRRLRKTALIVTHDLDEALYVADRVLLMAEGAVVADLPSGEVMSSQIPSVTEYVQAVHRADGEKT